MSDAAPSRLALNPVAWKDLLAYARSGSSGARLALPGIGLMLPLVILAWCQVGLPGPWRAIAPYVFVLAAALTALLGLVVAVPAATAFALERDRETLEGLVVSPLTPWRLVTGKLLAAVAIGLQTHVIALPALAVALLLGGGELRFIPQFLALLALASTSFASFCLLVGARRLDAGGRIGWMRAQATQAQLALQGTLGLGILGTLGPVYAAALLPLAASQGLPVDRLLDGLAPLGGIHPLMALLCWGDADVLGLRVPVWILGATFHALLTLPLLADAAEAQRVEGAAPGRATRLLALPVLALLLVLVASAARALPGPGRAAVGAFLPAVLLVGAAMRCAFVPSEAAPRVTRRRLLEGLRPDLALESAPDRSPGYLVLVALLCAPLLLGLVDGLAAWRGVVAVGLAGIALAALGARLVALGQEREEQALSEAVAKAADPNGPGRDAVLVGDGPGGRDDADAARRPRGPRASFFLRLLLLVVLLPAIGGAGLSLGTGPAPVLAAGAPVFRTILAFGLAINPLTGTLAVLGDPKALGSDVIARGLDVAGLDVDAVVGLHVAACLAALVVAVVTLRPPFDRDAALAVLVATATAPPSPPPATPATPSAAA